MESENHNPIDTSGATGKLIISILGALNAYEREINAERREFGYRRALEAGTVGRPKVYGLTDEFQQAYQTWREGKCTAVQAMQMCGFKKTTFYKLVREMEKAE